MKGNRLTRRLFLQGSGAFASQSALRTALPGVFALAEVACSRREETRKFAVLTDREAIEFEAIAARILPTTDTPGAVEAGVIWFFDSAFDALMKDDLGAARQGLDDLQSSLGGQQFSALDDTAQDRALEAIEDGQFFDLMRNMTIYGFFGMSQYGGNRDNLGWQLLGVDDPVHTWQPPFGFYDAEYMLEENNGE
jgi:gluconate 2-dehydrogenase gamma chain